MKTLSFLAFWILTVDKRSILRFFSPVVGSPGGSLTGSVFFPLVPKRVADVLVGICGRRYRGGGPSSENTRSDHIRLGFKSKTRDHFFFFTMRSEHAF